MGNNVVRMSYVMVEILLLGLAIQQVSSNLICNGDFQQYGLIYVNHVVNTFVPSNYSCWYNSIGEQIQVQQPALSLTAIVELSHSYQYILCQDVVLQIGHYYQLDFNVYNSLTIQTSTIFTKFNNFTILNHTTPAPLTVSNASISFRANSTRNQICFDQTYVISPYSPSIAPCLDNISLIEISPPASPTNTTLNMTNMTASMADEPVNQKFEPTRQKFQLNQAVKQGLAVFISLPLPLVSSLRCSYLLLDDIWLYSYAQKYFTGLIQVIFETSINIQLLKFQYLEKYLGWNQYKEQLRISDYRNHTVPRFVELQGASSMLLDSNFAFFVYSVPQKIIICSSLCLIFYLLYNYQASKYLRKFYFFKTCLIITLLEDNLAYFVFVCFLNMSHTFSFSLADKLSLSFTVVILFCLVHFALGFFPLVLRYLNKRANYFTDFTFRESAGFWYKSVRLVRNLLRSVVFCFYHYQLQTQLLMLSGVEATALIVSVVIELAYRVFQSKTMFSCHLIYYFFLLLLNLVLLAQQLCDEAQILRLVKETEELIIYALISIVILMMVLDIFSHGFEKKRIHAYEKQQNTQKIKNQNQSKIFMEESKGKEYNLKKQLNQKEVIQKMKNSFYKKSKIFSKQSKTLRKLSKIKVVEL